ncbi:MAG: excinuclease ABC subunit UvrC [Gammaproteobacteria bacterium]|nr:MAG: excinuclease ABC subunit UvrC [Gammaproteobacteria bacterium]
MFDSKDFLNRVTELPGVYQMLDEQGDVIYVGKARNLKKRLSSYFTRSVLPIKTQSLVSNIADINVITTNTENEALILENRLIKEYKPRYNILLRDDKSYPYIHLTAHEYPRLVYHRGAKKGGGKFFGPFSSPKAVSETLRHLQRIFKIRQCADSYFSNRSRPCLQHQINRCSAPCVKIISHEKYMQSINNAVLFLEGKSTYLIDKLVHEMEQQSKGLAFESAAQTRDMISELRHVLEKQAVEGEKGDLDIVALARGSGITVLQVFFIRNGQNQGTASFTPKVPVDTENSELIGSFISQYYQDKTIPNQIIVSQLPEDRELLESALSEAKGKEVNVVSNVRGTKREWLDLAKKNAENTLGSHINSKANIHARYQSLVETLELEKLPSRIECFDISHTMGEATVASCVVFNSEGPLNSAYRRFNITDITAGDDYAAMEQAIRRRYSRVIKESGMLPDILLIDGGKGQLSRALKVVEELKLHEILIVGIAKGEGRKPGLEKIIIPGKNKEFMLPSASMALHILQHVRDEAHRFALAGHRGKIGRKKSRSVLEDIPGLGPKRRQLLLKQFGGMQGLSKAGVADIQKIKGISKAMAQEVYAMFHSEVK